jgi:catechol 2,3-dioxygenase-like lactoylglutathione lyase family enzyme
MSHLELVALVVRDYDAAIRFFVNVLQFELVEDTPTLTNDGRPKRWVVVRPPGGQTGVLLARADGDRQAGVVGQQFAGRVGLFLRVDDFEAACQRMVADGVRFVSPPRDEPYGRVAVFVDLEGNRWDLLGPDPRQQETLESPPRRAGLSLDDGLVDAMVNDVSVQGWIISGRRSARGGPTRQ